MWVTAVRPRWRTREVFAGPGASVAALRGSVRAHWASTVHRHRGSNGRNTSRPAAARMAEIDRRNSERTSGLGYQQTVALAVPPRNPPRPPPPHRSRPGEARAARRWRARVVAVGSGYRHLPFWQVLLTSQVKPSLPMACLQPLASHQSSVQGLGVGVSSQSAGFLVRQVPVAAQSQLP